jgi:mannose-6-phosphate isomerase-like protein (cupin superfamily)
MSITKRRVIPPHGGRVFQAAAGTYVFKPSGVPHTFWNAGSVPARIQQVITPAGFENYSRRLRDWGQRTISLAGIRTVVMGWILSPP